MYEGINKFCLFSRKIDDFTFFNQNYILKIRIKKVKKYSKMFPYKTNVKYFNSLFMKKPLKRPKDPFA